jgi:hypothetical protein
MSIIAVRQAIKTALADVDGVTPYLYAPNTFKPGDAWAQWAGQEAADPGPYQSTMTQRYRVVLVTHADAQAADEQTDALLPLVIDALVPVLQVYEVVPGKIPADGSSAGYNALFITGETE